MDYIFCSHFCEVTSHFILKEFAGYLSFSQFMDKELIKRWETNSQKEKVSF